jgi:hypothetical protein
MHLMKWHIVTTLVAAALVTAGPAGAVSYSQEANYGDGGMMIRMSVPMGTVLNAGEEVAFKFQTLEDAYVIVFNIDSSGYVHLLHPEQGLSMAAARRTYDVPEGRNSTLLVSGETGVEFVFALAVPQRDWVDEDELSYLFSLDAGQGGDSAPTPYRIDGDPFLAANIIAAELVRGISRRPGVFLDFTYFYVNERVPYPCYLCGECDRRNPDSDCERYQIVADFQRAQPLVYPLTRAYDLVDQGVAVSDAPADQRTQVDFYPYRAEVYTYSRPYVYRVYDPWYYDPWYWDPWYAGWCYAPGAYPRWGWGVSVGWGWGWGGCGWGWNAWAGWGWGGYYCTPYYTPYYYDGGGGGYNRTVKFKTQYAAREKAYKSTTLVDNYRQSRMRSTGTAIAAKGTRSAASTSAYRTAGGRSTVARSGQGAFKRSTSYKRSGTTTVSGTRYDRTRTTYQKRTTPRSSVRGKSATRGTTTYRRPSSTNRTRSTWRTYRTPTTRNQNTFRSAPGRTTTRYRSTFRSTTPRSSTRGTIRPVPRSSTRGRTTIKSSPRRSTSSRSAVRGNRSAPRSRSSAPRSSSRSRGSRSAKRR